MIDTKRLTLRLLSPEFAPQILDALKESWADLSKWHIWPLKPIEAMTAEDVAEFCRYKQAQYSEQKDITWAAFDNVTNKFVGVCGFQNLDFERKAALLGFWVRSTQTGNGYATEMGKALIEYAFIVLQLAALGAKHAEGNHKSKCVLEKLGFSAEGLHDVDYLVENQPTKERHYILPSYA